MVRVEQLPEGKWRFTQPRVPGWVAVAGRPPDVVQALRRGYTEAQIAAHSAWRGTAHDIAVPDYRRSRPKSRGKRRCDVYSAEEWVLCEDGRWLSPRGLKFPEDRQVVQRVMTARRALGLPARPDPAQPETQPSPDPRPRGLRPVDLDNLDRRTG